MSHIVNKINPALQQESPKDRAARLYAEAQQAEAEVVQLALASLEQTITLLSAIGPVSSPDIRQNARRLADSFTAELKNLINLVDRGRTS